MGEVNVYFWGLICHVNNTPGNNVTGTALSDMAVLVYANDHAPMIVFGDDSTKRYKLDLATEVTFRDGTESATINRKQFDDYVPSLGQILGGRLLVPPEKVVYFRYPKADGFRLPALTVFDTYGYAANHVSKISNNNKRSEKPVARLIRLRVRTDAEAVYAQFTSGGDQKEVRVPNGDCILVSNVEKTFIAEAAASLKVAGEQLHRFETRAKEYGEELSILAQAIDSAATSFQLYAIETNTAVPNHFEYYSEILVASDTCRALEGKEIPVVTIDQDAACDWILPYVERISALIERSGVRPECGNTVYP